MIVEYLATSGAPVAAVQKRSFRGLCEWIYGRGWGDCAASKFLNTSQGFEHLYRAINYRGLNAAMIERAEFLMGIWVKRMQQVPFLCVSLDGVTIGQRAFMNFDLIAPALSDATMIFDFGTRSKMRTDEFVADLRPVLDRVAVRRLNVAGIVSDGCRVQIKGLNFRDEQSLQRVYPATYGKLLLIECVCHKLNNCTKAFYAVNPLYRDLIDAMRRAVVRLRKPDGRAALGVVVPASVETRWMFDALSLACMARHRDAIADNFPEIEIDTLLQLLPLLQIVYETICSLESDHASLASVVPQIGRCAARIREAAEGQSDPEIVALYHEFSASVQKSVLGSNRGLLQLAYILTPAGRDEARGLLPAFAHTPRIDADLRYYPSGGRAAIPGAEEPAEFEGAIVTDGEITALDGVDDVPIEPDEAVEDDLVAAGADIPDLISFAKRGLREILEQFALVEQVDRVDADAFIDSYLQLPDELLPVRRVFGGGNQFTWTARPPEGWATIYDIALRLEACVCSEATTERTNGLMRRNLGKHAQSMGHDVLLARMVIAKAMLKDDLAAFARLREEGAVGADDDPFFSI